jgi:hypothetical protein
MRARLVLVALLLATTALGGCGGRDDPSTPVACLEGAGVYLSALAEAPAEVRLDGETPISDCLAENQQGGDLATVGEAMVDAATKLNAEARADPGGPAGLRLGYLLGAAERGAEETEGIHTELVRRLTVAARYSPEGPLPAGFTGAYREGFDAGHAGG